MLSYNQNGVTIQKGASIAETIWQLVEWFGTAGMKGIETRKTVESKLRSEVTYAIQSVEVDFVTDEVIELDVDEVV